MPLVTKEHRQALLAAALHCVSVKRATRKQTNRADGATSSDKFASAPTACSTTTTAESSFAGSEAGPPTTTPTRPLVGEEGSCSKCRCLSNIFHRCSDNHRSFTLFHRPSREQLGTPREACCNTIQNYQPKGFFQSHSEHE